MFDDDDLNQLKVRLSIFEDKNAAGAITIGEFEALVARLDAAEKMSPILERLIDFINPAKNLKIKPTIEDLEKLLHQPASPVILEPDGTLKNIKVLDDAREAIEVWRKSAGKIP